MRVTGWSSAWVRRSTLAAVLVGIVLVPGHAAGVPAQPCRSLSCMAHGTVRWSKRLPGTWLAVSGSQGTTLSSGQAYAAVDSQVAAIGAGLSVSAYTARDGRPLWTNSLSWLAAGSQVTSVRVWPGVVTVGVLPPAGSTGWPRTEVVLDAQTGRRIAQFPASTYGGAVAADIRRTVVVGPTAVTGYSNAKRSVIWRYPTGNAPPAWRVDGGYLYVTISAGGVLRTAPVTAVRQINLATGAEHLIRPSQGPFPGTLSAVVDDVLLFSGSDGLMGYSAVTGERIWLAGRSGAVPAGFDPVQAVLYVDDAGALIGVDPLTGRTLPHHSVPGPSGSYGVLNGVALGIDTGPNGSAWGYSLASRHVVWTSRSLPWPHFFVDLSGIGGSADPASSTVILATCAKTGNPVAGTGLSGGTGVACLRPELVAIER